MAKGISHSADTTLVKGARDAYTDYSALTKSGYDLGYETGMQTSQQALEKRELRRQEDKAEEEKQNKIKQDQLAEWDKTSEAIIRKSGGLGDNMYAHAKNKTEQMKKEYVKALDSGDKNTEMDAFRALDGFASSISAYKEFRADSADAGMSEAMLQNEGRESEIYNHIFQDLSTITEDEKTGELIHTGTTKGGHEYSITEKELMDGFIQQNLKARNDFSQTKIDFTKNKTLDRDALEGRLDQVVPTKTGELRAFLADKIENQNWTEMIEKDQALRSEVDVSLFDIADKDGNKDGIIDDEEFKFFKKV